MGNPESIENKVDLVLRLLTGNPLDKEDDGIVGTLNDVRDRVAKLEKLKDRIMYIMAGMAIPTGVGITKIIALVGDKLFHIGG